MNLLMATINCEIKLYLIPFVRGESQTPLPLQSPHRAPSACAAGLKPEGANSKTYNLNLFPFLGTSTKSNPEICFPNSVD